MSKLIELIEGLHAFGKLDKRVLMIISEVFDIDAFNLCKEHGITYDL